MNRNMSVGRRGRLQTWLHLSLTALLIASVLAVVVAPAGAASSFIGPFSTVDNISTTVPANGDINPYGIVVVPSTIGKLGTGNVLVSNFNNSGNAQGTGTTIVQITPGGAITLFAQIDPAHLPGPCPGGVGLTTALAVLQSGWVIVGSLPTTDGTAATAQAGCLLVLNSMGQVVRTFSGPLINGPWDMTAVDQGNRATLFFTNVLNGTVAGNGSVVHRGTVVRMVLSIPTNGDEHGRGRDGTERRGGDGSGLPTQLSATVIGSGFAEKSDPDALVIGPTGLALGTNGKLYVADTVNSRIAAIPGALARNSSFGTGTTVTVAGNLDGPLGLAMAPNGDILAANANDGNLVEVTPGGAQVSTQLVEPLGAGSLFGLAITRGRNGVYFVDDADNTLKLFH